MRWLGLLIALTGLAIAVWAVRALGVSRFLGRPGAPSVLVFRGPYRRVRHPYYVGQLVFLLGLFVATAERVVAAVAIFALPVTAIAIKAEERSLVKRFGEAYRRYRRAVPALIPSRGTAARRA